jgi:hypothetical protein
MRSPPVIMASVSEGVRLLGFGCAPFVAGALVPADGDSGLFCPFRELTGLPCPLCGATRAFALAARGDARFLDFNAVWVLFAVLLVLAGAVVLVTGRRPRVSGAGVAVVVAATAWAYALVHRAAIVNG